MTPTDPAYGVLFLSSLLVILELKEQIHLGVWVFLVFSYLFFTVRSGIVGHLSMYDDDQYLANWSRSGAVAINLYGFFVLTFYTIAPFAVP